MKAFPYKRNRRGFSLTEFLAVIAILGVLLAAGIPTVLSLRKTIRIAKYDGIAREIYVAAQNSLLRLAANGMDAVNADKLSNRANPMTTTQPGDYEDDPEWDTSKDQYRCAGNGSLAMTALLPLGAIDDTIRVNGHYYVEYNVETNIIYGVFYSDSEFEYKDVADVRNFRTDRGTRKGFMVGYYGGSAVLRNPSVYCPVPQLEIINNNELRLNILNRPREVNVKVTVSDGVNPAVDATHMLADNSLLMDSIGDPLTNPNRFCRLFPTLQYGANLTLTVTYSEEGKIPSTASITTNSLFADRNGEWVTVAWARHLQNLQPSVSGLYIDEITHVRQIANIDWPQEYSFISINNPNLRRYEGNYREIRDLKGNNGLFDVSNNLELSAIRLVNPSISTNTMGGVGALAGTATNAIITNCGVYYEHLKDGTVDFAAYQGAGIDAPDAIVGGLVGKATGCSITDSFAALPQISAAQGGGLIGYADGCTIENSYANCDELPVNKKFYSFLDGIGNTVTHCYAVGNVNGTLTSAFCPADKGNTVTDSYFAVSHRDFAADKDHSDTQFVTYDGSGTRRSTNMDGLKAWKPNDKWVPMIAPLSHPYREYLDGRAYPYPAFEKLDHYGSWPTGDGLVWVTINMELTNSQENAKNAGLVVVTANGEQIYSSATDASNRIPVAPGTKITVTVTQQDGYEYVNTQVLTGSSTNPENSYTISKDTTVTVRFRQQTFTLNCKQAEDINGSSITNSRYYVDLTRPQKNLVVTGEMSEQVETGSTVTVRPVMSEGYGATVVWYEADGVRTYVNQNADGLFTFQMPAKNTTLHVRYTVETVHCNIEYYLMDTTGNYPDTPTDTVNNYPFGVGSQVNQAMIEAMAESSNLPLAIEGQQVRYLTEAFVIRDDGTELYHSTVDSDGNLNIAKGPYVTTSEKDNGRIFKVKIYIARRQYKVTLLAGEHISGVGFDGAGEANKISIMRYYGATVTAVATVEPGHGFTFWEPGDARFLMSPNPSYTFTVPHYDLELTASAELDRYLVTINLLENGESWLWSSPSRQADPITLTLVDSRNNGREYPMIAREEETVSYAMQVVVPRIQELGEGYYVRVDYASRRRAWLYTSGGKTEADNEKLLLTVRNQAVTHDAEFYSVTYHPNLEKYLGTVPEGGTYPAFTHVKVQGNTGLLRNETGDGKTIFSGWKDYYAEGTGMYTGGADLMLVRRTDLFAQWVDKLNVMYDGNGADGGELPVDRNNYNLDEIVTVKFTDLTRKGYRFLGWSRTKDGPLEFTKNGTNTFQIGPENVTLFAVWEKEAYTVRFYNADGTVYQELSEKHYGDTLESCDLEVGDGSIFVGWSLTQGGEVNFGAGEGILVTGNMDLYPCLTDKMVTVTYMSKDGTTVLGTAQFGKGVPGYLYCANAGNVTAWSTQENGKGTLYFCDENGRSESTHGFAEDTTLYAVNGKVYNYQLQAWYDTLGEAVMAASSGHTLIVYRDTEEPYNIWFNKSLYVLASGDRTVTWKKDATIRDSSTLLKDDKTEFNGCMNVANNGNYVSLEFGRSDISTLSMDGSTLTFDANLQSRVIALYAGTTFHMYDGITLTNGFRTGTKGINGNGRPDYRAGYGGGVYAGAGAVFYMHGGTISYCEAVSGGGVYLYIGSRMYMGDMVRPKVYSATAIYYTIKHDDTLGEDIYINTDGVTRENYKQFYVTDGNPEICYNHASQKWDGTYGDGGGGLLMLDLKNGDLILYRGSINNNYTTANGGGIVTDSGSKDDFLRIYEVDISHNTAEGFGGGILQWQGTVYVYNSTIRQNRAQKGGGIYLKNGTGKYNIEFYFGDISDNRATEDGGGVYAVDGAEFFLRGGNLCRNTAQKGGGGAYLSGSNSLLSLEKGTVSGNTAQVNGGGFYSEGTITMSGGTLSDNTAQENGGGIYSTKTVTLSGGALSGNRAEHYGGGIYFTGTTTMTGGTVCDNSARYLGGGIMVGGTLNLSAGSLYGNTDTDYEPEKHSLDEDNVNPGPNDIYLMGARYITIPTGGIHLSGEERVAVDSERDDSLRFNYNSLPFRFAMYEDPVNDYDPLDALYFTYYGTRSTEYSKVDLGKKDLEVATHEDVGRQDQQGLYLRQVGGGNKTSQVILDWNYPGCPKPYEKDHTVGDTLNLNTLVPVTPRTGYYIAGWSKTRDALEEDYLLYYDPIKGQWANTYDPVAKEWKGWSVDPVYTVRDYVSQTLYAMWKPCVVIYDLKGAPTEVTIRPISVGPRVILLNPEPMSFERNGKAYLFKGWTEDPNGETAQYQATQQLDLEKNLTLYAVWEERPQDTLVVTYYYNGGGFHDKPGEHRSDVSVTKGDSVTLLSGLTQAGRLFLGWATKQDARVPDYKPGQVISNLETDMTLYAVWDDAVSVTYDWNYPGAEKNVSVMVSGTDLTVTTEQIPVRQDYTFLGWAEAADVKEVKYASGAHYGPVYQDVTFYAVWQSNKVWDVSFHANGGNFEPETAIGTFQVHDEESLTIPAEQPIREGYRFLGWAETADAKQAQYQPGGHFMPTSDSTLYAVWGENVTLTFDLNYQGAPVFEIHTALLEETITILVEDPKREGYVFAYWAEKPDGTGEQYHMDSEILMDQDKTLYAVWNKLYTISFIDSVTDKPALSEQSITVGSKISLKTLTKKGYVFKGWVENRGTDTPFMEYTLQEAKNVTLYAVWVKTATLTYDLNGATETQAPASQTVEEGQSVTIEVKDPPTREGYVFAGWADSSDAAEGKYTNGSTIQMDQDKTIYAVWKKIVTLTLDWNYPYAGDPQTITATEGKVSLKVETPTRDGYSFKGWAKTDDATEPDYLPDTDVQLADDLTLYAVWEKNPTLTFNLNYPGADVYETQTGTQGETITINVNDPRRDGFVFKGWSESPEGEGTLYQYGGSYALLEDRTLYAVWEKAKTYTITFDLDGGSWPDHELTVVVEEGKGYRCLGNPPTKRGSYQTIFGPIPFDYDFTGWDDGKGNIYPYDTPIPVEGDITLTAVWTAPWPFAMQVQANPAEPVEPTDPTEPTEPNDPAGSTEEAPLATQPEEPTEGQPMAPTDVAEPPKKEPLLIPSEPSDPDNA